MREWRRALALGAVAAMVFIVPAGAQNGQSDDVPVGRSEGVEELVGSMLGDDLFVAADQDRIQQRLRDGTGDNCPGEGDCDGPPISLAADQDRIQQRLRDGTGDNCPGEGIATQFGSRVAQRYEHRHGAPSA